LPDTGRPVAIDQVRTILAVFQEQTFDSGELLLHFAAGPASGPPLVLLHGVQRMWQDYVTFAPLLAARWQVQALDFRGHGRSARGGSYLVTDYVRDAVAFLTCQVPEPAVVYGHSLGAMVAAAAAAAAPKSVRALVLEDPPFETLGRRIRETPFYSLFAGNERLLATPPRSVEALAREMAELRVTGPDGRDTVRLGDVRDATHLRFGAKCLMRMDPAVLVPLLEGRWLEGYDTERIARGIGCPTLLLAGDYSQGGMLPKSEAARIAGLIRHCDLVHLPGVGHLIHWMQPEAAARLTTGFLESL
jgi:pimeloyl-ACP methyl ester carboxylesterase